MDLMRKIIYFFQNLDIKIKLPFLIFMSKSVIDSLNFFSKIKYLKYYRRKLDRLGIYSHQKAGSQYIYSKYY